MARPPDAPVLEVVMSPFRSLAFVAPVVVAVLAGCSGGGGEPEIPGTGSVANAATVAPAHVFARATSSSIAGVSSRVEIWTDGSIVRYAGNPQTTSPTTYGTLVPRIVDKMRAGTARLTDVAETALVDDPFYVAPEDCPGTQTRTLYEVRVDAHGGLVPMKIGVSCTTPKIHPQYWTHTPTPDAIVDTLAAYEAVGSQSTYDPMP